MTFPELVWKTIELTFSDLPHFLGMIILLYVIRGGIGKAVSSIKDFFIRVKIKYLEKLADRKFNRTGIKNGTEKFRNVEK